MTSAPHCPRSSNGPQDRNRTDRRRERRVTLCPPRPLHLMGVHAPGRPKAEDDACIAVALVHATDLSLHSVGLLLPPEAPPISAGAVLGLRWTVGDSISWWTVVSVAPQSAPLPLLTPRRRQAAPARPPVPDSADSASETEWPAVATTVRSSGNAGAEPQGLRRVGCRRRIAIALNTCPISPATLEDTLPVETVLTTPRRRPIPVANRSTAIGLGLANITD